MNSKKFLSLIAFALIIVASQFVNADDFSDYGNYSLSTLDLPTIQAGYGVKYDIFPDCNLQIDRYNVKGRILAANDKSIYLQKNYGAGGNANFLTVGTVPLGSGAMDPTFIKISPDGEKIALGLGWGQPIYVFPTSMLSVNNPVELDNDVYSQISVFDTDCYEAVWIDDAGSDYRLAINRGNMVDYTSEVVILDTTQPVSASNPKVVIAGIDGSSADVDVDLSGNLITGNGWATGRTGEIKIVAKTDWETAYSTGSPVQYETDPKAKLLANNILSAADLGVDKDNNLHVGGGDFLDGSEQGFAAVVHNSVLTRVLAGGLPVDENNTSEYKELAPDPAGDDTATNAEYNSWGESLYITWNPDSGWWGVGVTPRITAYYSSTPKDVDSDGIPDLADNAYLVSNSQQLDSDSDGWGDACDCDYDQNDIVNAADYNMMMGSIWQSNSLFDHNEDGIVNAADYNMFMGRLWSQPGD